MTKQERKNRILARGEFKNHAHVIVGDADVIRNDNGEVIIEVGNEGAILKHILELDWMEGIEVWSGEHTDIAIEKGKYKYVQQQVFDPLTKRIEDVRE